MSDTIGEIHDPFRALQAGFIHDAIGFIDHELSEIQGRELLATDEVTDALLDLRRLVAAIRISSQDTELSR